MVCSSQINSALEHANEYISASNVPQFDSINFDWHGMTFSASSDAFGTNSGRIKLSAVIGRLYFTIEDERLRNESVKQIYQNNRSIDGSYKLEKDGTVTFSSLTLMDNKVRGSDFIKALTMIMLESNIHLKKIRAYLKAA